MLSSFLRLRSVRCGHCITPCFRQSFLNAVVHMPNFFATSDSGRKFSRNTFSVNLLVFVGNGLCWGAICSADSICSAFRRAISSYSRVVQLERKCSSALRAGAIIWPGWPWPPGCGIANGSPYAPPSILGTCQFIVAFRRLPRVDPEQRQLAPPKDDHRHKDLCDDALPHTTPSDRLS
eukprot:14205_3